ncbi:MAG: sulfatase-like hydrolase/transferase [Ignavibacteria bacterium]|nr:sulfatase-like hydrolase/transferase [Ignavibacteria bacterium]
MNRIFSKQFVVSIAGIAFLLITASLLRLGFYLTNLDYFAPLPFSDIVTAFLAGIRFDISGILYLNIIIIVIFNLPYLYPVKRIQKVVYFTVFIALNLLGFFVSVADFGYFRNTQRRLSFEIFVMTEDIVRYIPSLIQNHIILFLVFLIISFIFVFLAYRLFLRIDSGIRNKKFWLSEILGFVIIMLITATGIRGGFQLKPIRQADAFRGNMTAGYLSMNTPFNIIRSRTQPVFQNVNFMDKNESRYVVRKMIFNRDEKPLSDGYTFMRKTSGTGDTLKPNIVIFMMESWSAKYSNAVTGNKSYTPFFDSLSKHGLLFTDFFANGQRSIEAVPSVLVSVPSFSGNSLISSSAEMNKFRGLGSILNENGYYTSFHHGATTGSMGFNSFTKLAGFNEYFGKENFIDPTGFNYDGVWGVYDEPFFIDAASKMNTFNQPFCSVIFSLSSHDPFSIPVNRKEFFEKYKGENELDVSVRYSDFSLSKFFEYAGGQKWFDNTIFLITADHTLFNSRVNYTSTYHIPLLIYSPQYIKPGIYDRIASQVDIMPSLIDLLNISTVHSSMGVSFFDTTISRFSFQKFGEYFCIIDDEFVLITNFEKEPDMYRYKTDPNLTENVARKNKDISDGLLLKLTAYYQEISNSVAEDKIYNSNP